MRVSPRVPSFVHMMGERNVQIIFCCMCRVAQSRAKTLMRSGFLDISLLSAGWDVSDKIYVLF